MPTIFETLQEMELLLRSEGRSVPADLLKQIGSEGNSSIFSERVASLEVWGGEGSVVDVTLKNPIAERRFNELIVDLAEALDQLRISNFRSRWVAQIIEDWLNAHPT